jgi:CheY-like chemotaxis protein
MTKKLLLLAEDDENDALLLERALRRAGSEFRLVHVPDGEQAVAYIAGLPPFSDRNVHPPADLLLLDLKMPRMDGFEVLRWRRTQTVHSLPVIVFSSSTLERDILQAYVLGASSYAVKPLRSEMLDAFARALVAWWGSFNVSGSRVAM